MKPILLIAVLFLCALNSCAQSNSHQNKTATSKNKKVGGPCEGCKAIYETPIAFEQLPWSDTLPDYSNNGHRLHLTGTVYQHDGKTPAPGVVLYIYHTNQTGIYPTKGGETGWDRRHGYLRGWVKTNSKGEYAFYTLKPAAYPGRQDPAHIHITIKEKEKNEYWIDEFVFADDPLLTEEHRRRLQNRGGSGVLNTQNKNGILYASRNIILGKNVPDYE